MVLIYMLLAYLLLSLCIISNNYTYVSASVRTGFWYGETRPPQWDYNTFDYATLVVRITRPYTEGPGKNLVSDPYDSSTEIFSGLTINRQSFDTQFILDMNYAIGIDTQRVYIISVTKGDVHFSWEAASVYVKFIFLERNSTSEMTLLEAIAELTNQIQQDSSRLYHGTNVTQDLQKDWGLIVEGWDVSLRLTYAIEIVGGSAVSSDGMALNQGGLGSCDAPYSSNISYYCEFERFFEDDVSRALNISHYRVQILFVKKSALDSVLVHFRISPARDNSESTIAVAIATLMTQVQDPLSDLYQLGNVTLRTDSAWGVSQVLATNRKGAALFTKRHYEYDPSRLNSPKRQLLITAYDRCKMNRRCNWGIVHLDQEANDVRYYHQLYDFGKLYGINLFLDFEDWRLGTRGWSWSGQIPPTARGSSSISRARAPVGTIKGAHFLPFDEETLGVDIPCYLYERNQGLVLDRILHTSQIDLQAALVDDIFGRIDWIDKNIEVADHGPVLRSRRSVKNSLEYVKQDFTDFGNAEVSELIQLNNSMCVNTQCTLLFNTTSAEMTGAINVAGIIKTTDGGDEVAVFTFNSIYLGPEVKVTLVGQRPLILMSRTTAVINTTFHGDPGTLGGFQGGGNVGRYFDEDDVDQPRSVIICDIGSYCLNRTAISIDYNQTYISNNVNGPGSGNLRVYPYVIEISADDTKEVQYITTAATAGQTLAGGFLLKFKSLSTPVISHDITASEFKRIIEDNLNVISPDSQYVRKERELNDVIGIGSVTVSRTVQDDQEGYTWLITFDTAIGNIDQIQVSNYLQGVNAYLTYGTVVNGNELGGTFTLSFQGDTTAPISTRESAVGLQSILSDLPSVTTAFVDRTDKTEKCDDGLCNEGPNPARGLIWTIYITTDSAYGDVTPTSPTSPVAKTEAAYHELSYDLSDVTGTDARMQITRGTGASPNSIMALLNVSIPFSLAYGGAGASYGGLGGAGYGPNPVGLLYNDVKLTQLMGGSGGCMKSAVVFEINSVRDVASGQGGHGGGAIEVVAATDVVIGNFGKILMRGGDAQQSSGGGGGGGSGGAILLSAGGTIINEGVLDVQGGDGGYGGSTDVTLAGGGGGGGRIAVFAESITVSLGQVISDGGACGIYKRPVMEEVVAASVTIIIERRGELSDDAILSLANMYVNKTVQTADIVNVGVESINLNDTNGNIVIRSMVNLTVHFDVQYNMSSLPDIDDLFKNTYGYNIGGVYFFTTVLSNITAISIYPVKSLPTVCTNVGSRGSVYTQASATTSLYVAETNGAEGTKRALFLSNNENTNTTSGSFREAPFSWNGPIIPFEASRPTRVTYYTRLDVVEGESKKANFGVLFSLLSRGEPGLDVSSVIAVFTGDRISHGANFGSAVDEKVFLKRSVTIWEYMTFDTWYKVDIHINWNTHSYYILLDDVVVVEGATFVGEDVDGIRISVTRAVNVWFDEIYVGFDNTLGFSCPSTYRTGTKTLTPEQMHWNLKEVSGSGNPFTQYNRMTRHYSHLDVTGSIPFDGQGSINNFQDIKNKFSTGDYAVTQGILNPGSMNYISLVQDPKTLRSGNAAASVSNTKVSPNGLWYTSKVAGDGRQFWYTEYNYISDVSDTLNGGVAACSSGDLLSWRFEGFVFHYTNLSDMVYGSDGPFHVERPKVKYNKESGNYVLWSVMDNVNRTLAMTAVATSPYVDGPFLFARSFYPDGNQTRDQVVFNDGDIALLGRTYYLTVEYLLPQAIMQPVWESVKDRSGQTNFRINYLRGVYDVGYDNYHDIYAQRWRLEDISYEVYCQNKMTMEVHYVSPGEYRDPVRGTVCIDPFETKFVLGQGNPVAKSNFVDPSDSNNSFWIQTSVPAVKAQPWASSYRDGYCGIRTLDDNLDINDPDLDYFESADRGSCSNIADNPIHVAAQDKLIGIQRIVSSRRSKFMAVSALTDDYLDTSGITSSYEGELLSGDLISMIIEQGQFGFAAGNALSSTYQPPRRSEYENAVDYQYRFMQYIRNFNDRASYSLACIIDGVCPVNYADAVTKNAGHH